MDLDFTSEQTLLRDTAAKFFVNNSPYAKVREMEESEAGCDMTLWASLAEMGWLGVLFPEEYGGYGGQFIDIAIILEEMGKMVFPSPFFSTVIQSGLAIVEGGTEEQKKTLLPQIADGSLIMALAQYEADGSYDPRQFQMKAEAVGDGYILNGEKLFVMDANVARTLIVAAKTKEGLSLFLVNADTPGITIKKMATIGKDNNCAVAFKNVKVSGKDILGTAGKGAEALERMNTRGAVAKAAEMLGGCKAAIDITADYAKQRIQYGKPIGGFQAIQHFMANMVVEYDTNLNYLYRVVSMIDEGEDFAAHSSALKAGVNEAYKFISERAVQIHGGIGTTRECDISLFYRKAKASEYICGNSDYHYSKVFDYMAAQKDGKF
ncbi:MAG: acyl-CoA dehydrogenase family protein [Smithellaceae bacterium]